MNCGTAVTSFPLKEPFVCPNPTKNKASNFKEQLKTSCPIYWNCHWNSSAFLRTLSYNLKSPAAALTKRLLGIPPQQSYVAGYTEIQLLQASQSQLAVPLYSQWNNSPQTSKGKLMWGLYLEETKPPKPHKINENPPLQPSLNYT